MTPLRHRSPVHPSNCALAASFDLIGDRWSLMIVRSALYGLRRFEDFQSELSIPRTVLTVRLKRLVVANIMTRQEYRVAGSRPRAEYLLTEMGEALRLPFLAMRQWADLWIAGGTPLPMTLIHRPTGERVHIACVDNEGRAVDPDDLTARFEPWAPEPRLLGAEDANANP